MQNTPLDFGYIFAGLDTLLLKQTDLARSNAELFLNLFRMSDPDRDYSSEHALFRKIRSNNLTEGELINRCLQAGIGIHSGWLDHLNEVPAAHQGAWCLLYSFVLGIKQKAQGKKDLLSYLNFIQAHCELERNLIVALRTSSAQESTEVFASWILIDSTATDDGALNKFKRASAVIFYWAALYEKYLHIEFGNLDWELTGSESPSLLVKYLPKLNKNRTKVINSNWCFIESYKTYLTDKAEGKLFDADLYRAVCEHQTAPNSEPNEEAIQRMFKKIKAGNSPLTTKFVLSNLIPLTGRSLPIDYRGDSTLMIVHFLNLFTRIQLEAIESGLELGDVIELFDRYPSYVDAVNRRLINFNQSGYLAAI